MATSRHLAVVRNDNLPDVMGESVSSSLAPVNRVSLQRIANRRETGLGRINNVGVLTEAGEGELTGLMGTMMHDYTRVHAGATQITLQYEQQFPSSPFDLRTPMGDLLSAYATSLVGLYNTAFAQINDAITYGSELEDDERGWLERNLWPLPRE